MGTHYVRDEELPSELEFDFSLGLQTYDLQHIYSELPLGNNLEIHVVQQSSLSFVELQHYDSKTTIVFDFEGVQFDEYELVLESFDAASSEQNILKTDRVIIKPLVADVDAFIELEPQILSFGLNSSLNLNIKVTEDAKEVVVQPDYRLEPYV